MSTAIFLGAGASKADGAPLQMNLFKEYFQNLQHNRINNPDNFLIKLFRDLFDINVLGNLIQTDFPSFEEVLGILEMTYSRKETFLFQEDGENRNFIKIEDLKSCLNKLISIVLKNTLENYKHVHDQLVKKLVETNLINETIFITSNYDLLCDNAICRDENFQVDYGFPIGHDFNRPHKIKLYKLHGSLNWLVCPVCNTVNLTPFLKNIENNYYCENCNTHQSKPIIIAPSYVKDLAYPHLAQIWNQAEIALKAVDHIIFCGYSFPDADINIKYLIKRIQKNRPQNIPLHYTVINNHQHKTKHQKEEEKKRYKRFLGPQVDYTKLTFNQFVKNPLPVFRNHAGIE